VPSATSEPVTDRACVVIGGATHSTLAAVRSIAQQGVPTFAATLDRRSVPIFRASRASAGVRRIEAASPEGISAELLAFAEEAFPTATSVLVLSTSERAIDHLDAARDRLDPRFELAIPPAGCCRALLDKAESLALAEQAGLSVPPWACVRTLADVDALPDLRLPVCVRPTAWDTVGSRFFKIEIFTTAPALRTGLEEAVAGGGTFIVQEYVGDADDLDVGMAWASGDGTEVRTWTGRKRRSSSPEGGVLAWGETADLPDVDAAIRAFVATAGYRGIGGIELLRSGDDLWFIEFNPRLEAFHRLGAISGFDAPALAVGEWSGRPLPPDRRVGSAAMWVGAAWSERVTHDRRGLGLFVADGLRFLAHRRRACSLWSFRDPAPAFASVRGRASRGTRKRLGKVRAKLRGGRS
jgi:predicted ATP-grasp superfamily ATP-dependent carboligase